VTLKIYLTGNVHKIRRSIWSRGLANDKDLD